MPTRKKRKKDSRAGSDPADSPLSTCPFSWDGISFQVPENWHLAIYQYFKKVTRLEFEDDYTIRIEAEWTRPVRDLDIQRIQKRYDNAARKFTENADQSRELAGLPEHWVATLYWLAEGHRLVTAMFIPPDSSLFAFFLFHFEPRDSEDPKEVTTTVAESFQVQEGPLRKWVLYDISLEMPSDFKLFSTRFETGLKLFVFRWQRRRFCLWFINLADLIQRKHAKGEWLARLFNSSRQFKPIVFRQDEGDHDKAIWRRRRRHVLGHVDEIARRCFRYRPECFHDVERNMFIPWVFNHRKDQDLARLDDVVVNGKYLTRKEAP